jgi:hypothetical protein
MTLAVNYNYNYNYKTAALNDLAKQNNIVEVDQVDKEKLIKDIEEEVANVVDSMVARNEIKETTAQFVKHKAKEHRLARFYTKWKCHKYQPTMTEFANAAVRGIVSCSGTADEKACDFLDFVLNPGMRGLRSYLTGTKDFLIWIETLKDQYPELPPLFSIITMDFTCMYPTIPDDLVLPAVRDYLESRRVAEPSTEKTMACLAAGKLEEEAIFTADIFKNKVLKDTSNNDEKSRFYKRFIDDMIAAFLGTEQEAKDFVDCY